MLVAYIIDTIGNRLRKKGASGHKSIETCNNGACSCIYSLKEFASRQVSSVFQRFNFSEFSEGGMSLFSYTEGNFASPGFSGSATLCPYRYYADGLGTYEDLWTWLNDHPTQNGQFSSGATNMPSDSFFGSIKPVQWPNRHYNVSAVEQLPKGL